MATGSIKQNPTKRNSGNWTWWEFETGLIIGIAAIPVSYTPSSQAGSVYRTASAVSLGSTPFEFSKGEFTVMASQVQWAANPSVSPNTQELACYFISTVNSARTPTAHVVFVGEK